jgi:hypothetical protein
MASSAAVRSESVETTCDCHVADIRELLNSRAPPRPQTRQGSSGPKRQRNCFTSDASNPPGSDCPSATPSERQRSGLLPLCRKAPPGGTNDQGLGKGRQADPERSFG